MKLLFSIFILTFFMGDFASAHLTPQEVEKYYHLDQGSQMLPYDLFLKLERHDSRRKFSKFSNLKKYGFLKSPFKSKLNPGGKLPIGFAINNYENKNRPEWSGRWVGVTCSACHQGQLQMDSGHKLPLLGGASKIDFPGFLYDLNQSINKVTGTDKKSRKALKRLMRRLHRSRETSKETHLNLAKGADLFREYLKEKTKKITLFTRDNQTSKPYKNTFRMDAIANTHSRLFASAMGIPENAALNDNLVKSTALWWVSDFEFHHNLGLLQPPLKRNMIQSIGTFAAVDLTSSSIQTGLFDTSSNVENLRTLEKIIKKMSAPKWNEKLMGPIDAYKVSQGKALYQAHCTSCHGGAPTSDSMSSPSQRHPFSERKLIRIQRIPIFDTETAKGVGTDSAYSEQWTKLVSIPDHILPFVPPHFVFPGQKTTRGIMAGVLGEAITGKSYAMNGAHFECGESDECVGGVNLKFLEFNDFRDPDPRLSPFKSPQDFLAYRAPLLAGVWANAPYLHNGSVPTIYDLLSPVSERPQSFEIKNVIFDNKKVGIKTKTRRSRSKSIVFDTTEKGDQNIGHEFNGTGSLPGQIGPYLKPSERYEIIEYLKTNLRY